jgi:hypothetical protein
MCSIPIMAHIPHSLGCVNAMMTGGTPLDQRHARASATEMLASMTACSSAHAKTRARELAGSMTPLCAW